SPRHHHRPWWTAGERAPGPLRGSGRPARPVTLDVVSFSRRLRGTAAVLVAGLVLSGCGADEPAEPAPVSAAGTAHDTAATPGPLAPQCESPLDSLTQRERIAQLFTVGV